MTNHLTAKFVIIALICPLLSFAQAVINNQNSTEVFGQAQQVYQQESYLNSANLYRLDPLENLYSDTSELRKLISELNAGTIQSEEDLTNYLNKYKGVNTDFNFAKKSLGVYYFQNRNYKLAIDWLEKVDRSRLDKEQSELTGLRKTYAYIQIGEYSKAQSELDRIGDSQDFQKQIAYFQGYLAYSEGDLQRAKELLKSSERTDIDYLEMDIAFRVGAFDEAIEEGLVLYPKSRGIEKKNISKVLGESYFNLKQFDRAQPYLENYSGSGIKVDDTHYYMLGYCYYLNGEYAKSLNQFNKIVSGKDEVAQNAYYHLAAVYLKLDKKSEALNAFRNATSLRFNESITEDAFYNYAKLSYEIGNPYEMTSSVLKDYVASYPDGPHAKEISDLLISSFITEKTYDIALEYVEAQGRSKFSEDYQVLLNLKAIQLLEESKALDALEYFRKSLSWNRSKKQTNFTYFWAGEAAYSLGDFPRAISNYKLFIQTSGQGNKLEEKHIDYQLAYAYFKNSQYEESRDYFKSFVQKNQASEEKLIDAKLRAGDASFLNKNYWPALEYYNSVIEADKQDLDYATYQKALAFGLVQRGDQKIELLSSFQNKFPQSNYRDEAYYELGSTLANRGDNKKALESFKKLNKEFPKSQYSAKAYLKEGLIYYNQEENERALNVFKILAENFSGSEEASQAVSNIEQIYVDQGNVEAYAKWVKTLDYVEYTDSNLADAMYRSAEQKFRSNQFKESSKLFENYLSSFPNGRQALASHFYAGQSYMAEQMAQKALPHFQTINQASNNTFTVKSAEQTAVIFLEENKWKEALVPLTKLEGLNINQELLRFAQSNIMKCYTEQEDYQKAGNYAQKVLNNSKVNSDLKRDAIFTLGRADVAAEKYSSAANNFTTIIDQLNGEDKMLARYYMAYDLNQKGAFEDSNSQIKSLIKESASNPYWGAKGLLIMSKNFSALNDQFQASYILESLIKNYPQYKDLTQEASDLLKTLKATQNEE